MKRPTVASLKKVTPENLAALGAERLAEILVAAAQTRPEMKRRLRMELAAEQGSEHLAPEVDRRLASLETSKSKVSWRQRPTFVRDLDTLRVLIAERLAGLDRPGALARMFQFMDLSKRLGTRVRDKDGELAAVFGRAAADIGRLLEPRAQKGHDHDHAEPGAAASALVNAVVQRPAAWAQWLPVTLAAAPQGLAAIALTLISARADAQPGWVIPIRQLADAACDVDAWLATFTAKALLIPANAAQAGRRLLAAGRTDEAGRVLEAAAPPKEKGKVTAWLAGKAAEPDPEWETVWIDWLEQSGQGEAAQAARWSSFERTLSVDRAREFTRRLADFDDVEAEQRAFEHASRHDDFAGGLAFLMDWPAFAEAGRMITARPDEIEVGTEDAELWAARLRARNPKAALLLLRKAATAAFKRREFKVSERLTQEADAIAV